MDNNNIWLQQAVYKLNELHMTGSSFKEELWELEWDDSLTDEENIRNDGKYGLALEALTQAKVVDAIYRPNMEGDGPDIYAYYLEGFDYDRFLRFCETYGFSLSDKGAQAADIIKDALEDAPAAPRKIAYHQFEPKHYNQKTGKLALSATDDLFMTASGKVARLSGAKYLQCLIMEKVFKSVNSIRNGVLFSTILGVNDTKMNKKMEKKIRNTVSEINTKVAEVGGPDNLIKIQNKKVFVNNSYL